MASGTVADNRTAVDTKLNQDFNLINRQLEITNSRKLAQEEQYANYAIKQREALTSRLIQIETDRSNQEKAIRAAELARLRTDIETRSSLEEARVKRELQIESDRAGFLKLNVNKN